MKIKILFASLFVSVLAQGIPSDQLEFISEGSGIHELSWCGVSGRTYFVKYSEDAEDWGYAPFIELGDGNPIEYGLFSQAPKAFFRLAHTDVPTTDPESADFDGDGLGNLFELVNSGTDPLEQDSDNNSMSDGLEDSDADGATNQAEAAAGTEARYKDHPLVNLTLVVTSG